MASSDDGEIRDDRAGDLKATSLSHAERNGVDRQDRQRNRNSSPDFDTASRYSNSSRRSRSPRGYKRSHDDRDRFPNARGRGRGQDSRRDRGARNDYWREENKRSRIAYDDLDRPAPRGSNQGYDHDWRSRRDRERDRSRERGRFRRGGRDRFSGRSPPRHHRSPSPRQYQRGDRRDGKQFVREGYSDQRDSRELLYDDADMSARDNNPATRKDSVGDANQAVKDDAKSQKDTTQNGDSAPAATTSDIPMMEDYEEPEEFDEEAEIERRRKRREELLAKSSSATPLLRHAVGASTSKAQALSPASFQSDTPQMSQRSDSKLSQSPRSSFESPRSPMSQDAPSPGALDLFDDKDLVNSHAAAKVDDEDGPSAAEYDPTVDMMEDGRRDELRHGQVVIHGEPEPAAEIEQNPAKVVPSPSPQKPSGEGEDDDDFDMFADEFDEEKYASKAKAKEAAAPDDANDATEAVDKGGILEGDDKDGYYKIRIGEVLNGRYLVQATLGRGMFSGVARAVDITTKQVVAIKMMRNNDALRKGGYTEIAILQKLNDADPENRKHIVKFERSFDHRGHLCMAFENLSMNLREVLRKFGNNVGINLKATRAYAYQAFVALAHMRKCSIIHADLKPDNILVNETRSVLKICDLGTAIDRSDAATAHTEITPYLVSRFYRAPEIILGMPYNYGVDMWSIGCTLYELYTGKILFTGDSNNQMLKAIMEVRGRITPKLYKRGQLSSVHFDDQGQFISVERDKVLGKTTLRTLNIIKPTRDLRTRLLAASSGMDDAESRELNHFIDLLDHCLALNPDKRLKPADALKHPFFVNRSGVARR